MGVIRRGETRSFRAQDWMRPATHLRPGVIIPLPKDSDICPAAGPYSSLARNVIRPSSGPRLRALLPVPSLPSDTSSSLCWMVLSQSRCPPSGSGRRLVRNAESTTAGGAHREPRCELSQVAEHVASVLNPTLSPLSSNRPNDILSVDHARQHRSQAALPRHARPHPARTRTTIAIRRADSRGDQGTKLGATTSRRRSQVAPRPGCRSSRK